MWEYHHYGFLHCEPREQQLFSSLSDTYSHLKITENVRVFFKYLGIIYHIKVNCLLNAYNVEIVFIFQETKELYQFEIIINVLVRSFRFICLNTYLPML